MPNEFISRVEWGAKPPQGKVEPFKEIVKHVLYVYFTATDTCYSKLDCSSRMRDLQERCFENGAPDIYYSFLVGGDGNIYEGRGWHFVPDSYRRLEEKLADNTISIAFLGDLKDDVPNFHQWKGGWKVIDVGVRNQFLSEDSVRLFYCG